MNLFEEIKLKDIYYIREKHHCERRFNGRNYDIWTTCLYGLDYGDIHVQYDFQNGTTKHEIKDVLINMLIEKESEL